jgi:transcriptional regulator with XRE-family HTH domain
MSTKNTNLLFLYHKDIYYNGKLYGGGIMIGERIKMLRENKGISQNKLAAMLGLSRSSVSAWEKGLNCPTAYSLIELADIFGVSVDCILGVKAAPSIDVTGLDDEEIAVLVRTADKFKENRGNRRR